MHCYAVLGMFKVIKLVIFNARYEFKSCAELTKLYFWLRWITLNQICRTECGWRKLIKKSLNNFGKAQNEPTSTDLFGKRKPFTIWCAQENRKSLIDSNLTMSSCPDSMPILIGESRNLSFEMMTFGSPASQSAEPLGPRKCFGASSTTSTLSVPRAKISIKEFLFSSESNWLLGPISKFWLFWFQVNFNHESRHRRSSS